MAKQKTTRQGVAGTYIAHGVIAGVEENRKLRHDLARGTPSEPGVFDKMRRQDPKLAALLASVKAPILGAEIRIVPPDDADDTEIEITEFVEASLHGLDGGPRRFYRELLTYLDFGFAAFEEVYRKQPDGRVSWEAFEPRLQTTVQRWLVDEATDKLKGVEFRAPFGGSDWKTYELDARNLTLFVRNQEGNNFEGVSLLRPAFTFWTAKRQVLRGTTIDIERAGHGYMKFSKETPGDWRDRDLDLIEETAINWRTNEDAFAALPFGVTMEFEFPQIPIGDRVRWLDYLDQQMVSAFMATFLQLGLTPSGTQALAKELRSNFLGALRSEADYVEDVMNARGGLTVSGPIQRLVDFNWGPQPQGRYPMFRIGRLSDVDVSKAIGSIITAFQAGALGRWTDDDANHVRRLADLSPMEMQTDQDSEPGMVNPSQDSGGAEGTETDEDETAAVPMALGGPLFMELDGNGERIQTRRQLQGPEVCVAYAALGRIFDEGGADFESAVSGALEALGADVAKRIRSIISSDAELAIQVTEIAEVQASIGTRLAVRSAVASYLDKVGKQTTKLTTDEVNRQLTKGGLQKGQKIGKGRRSRVPIPVRAIAVESMDAIAEAQAMLTAVRLIDEVLLGARDAGARAATLGAEAAAAAVSDLDRVAVRASAFYRKHAASPTAAVIAQARETASQAALEAQGIEDVDYVMFSSVLDEASCGPCRDEDGQEFPYGSAEYLRLKPPYQSCDGRGRCRCIFVFVGSKGTSGMVE